MNFCPTCGLDRQMVAPALPCPRCGTGAAAHVPQQYVPQAPHPQASPPPPKRSGVGRPLALLVVIGASYFLYYRQTHQRVVDDHSVIEDGRTLSYKLPEGDYEARVTATKDGVKLKWVGAECAGTRRPVESVMSRCSLPMGGQLVVENPSTLGLGASTTATVVVVER